MGHVDHGKTSLLNALRKLPFAGEKPGGVITQEMGAFEIEVEGKKITFLDTPGHEAFSQMRFRGAKVADIGVLVISAIEGPKEQTREALDVLKKANIPFLVAINKIDLPGADSMKVKRELMKWGVTAEEFGGDIPMIETSAKTGENLHSLLELILLLSEVKCEIHVNVNTKPRGVIIESHLDPKRGILVTIILEEGTLKEGDIIGTSSSWGRVRWIERERGKRVDKILPGEFGMVSGFEIIPRVGEVVLGYESIEEARANVKIEKIEREQKVLKEGQKMLQIILKTDTLGSLEAIEDMIEKIPQERVVINIAKSGAGQVNEDDLKFAKTINGVVFAFKTGIDNVAKKILEREKIRVWSFSVIYELIEAIRKLSERVLEPEIARVEIGRLKVLVNFWRERNRQIVGGKVVEGQIKRGAKIEVWRDEMLLGEGRLINLQKNKKDVEVVNKGEEAGILYEGEIKIKEDDLLVFYLEEKRKLDIEKNN